MLIKNFEACKISKEDSLTIIIKPILNEISNEKQIKNDILVNLFTNKICECINCTKNDNDINSINGVINSLLNESKNELFSFIQAFLDIFDSVKIYTDNLSDEENIIKKINISLFQYKEYFQNSYTNKFISFSNFRGLLNNKNIILDDESIEYVIYRMKKDCPNIKSKIEAQNDKSENKDNINEKEDKKDINDNKNEIIISNEKNTNSILINLNNGKTTNVEQKDEVQNNNNVNANKDNNEGDNKDKDKDKNDNGEIMDNNKINLVINYNCSIFDLNYNTFLNLI
jgi:hypothetical protein